MKHRKYSDTLGRAASTETLLRVATEKDLPAFFSKTYPALSFAGHRKHSKEVAFMKKARRIVFLMTITAFLLTLQTIWAGGEKEAKEKAVEAKTIEIGYVAPFTGAAAEFGTNGWRGIQIAVEEINQQGIEVNGETYNLQIVRYDSICEPTEGVASTRKAILEDRVKAILGGHCSSVSMAIAPLCDENQIPGITIESAATGVTSPGHEYYYRMRPDMALMAPALAPKIAQTLKPETQAFLAVNDDYGRSFAESFGKVMEEQGVETVAEIFFERGSTDYMPYLSKLRNADPDVVFYVGVTPEGATILKQAREVGMIPEMKFIGAEEMGEHELLSLAGEDVVEDTYAVSLWATVPKDFANKVQAKFDAPMHYGIIFGYDAVYVLKTAIEQAQSTDSVEIKKALDTVEYDGFQGHIKFEDFDDYKNQGRYEPFFIKWEGGEKVPQ